jgi:hypothetical protein
MYIMRLLTDPRVLLKCLHGEDFPQHLEAKTIDRDVSERIPRTRGGGG